MKSHFSVIPCFIDYFGRSLIDYALNSVLDRLLFILDNIMLYTVRVIDLAFFPFISTFEFWGLRGEMISMSVIFSLNTTASLRGSKFRNSERDNGTTRIP